MTTITEDYVSFEIAKLLKEKGFDYSSYCHYRLNDGELCNFNTNCNTNLKQNDYITAPTLQMAMKWFLKKHNIFICILFMEDLDGFGYTIEDIVNKKCIASSGASSYKEPEQACEAAIKYCLENLI